MAGRYGGNATEPSGMKTQPYGVANEMQHEHGYEWEQAREQERSAREQSGAGAAPPGYDTSAPLHTDTTGYTPPPGPPPTKRQMSSGAV